MVKKILIFYCILISFAGCSPQIKNLNNKGKNIIFFGNSITEGVGAESYESYPALLEKLTCKKVINAGLRADTTYSALKRLEDVLKDDPYLVIVELGGNDFLNKLPKKDTVKNLREIILKIQSKNAIAVLCDISDGFILEGYHNDLKKLAKETGAVFVPHLFLGILNNPSLKSDYIHPNKKGYEIIAKRIYERIKRYLN